MSSWLVDWCHLVTRHWIHSGTGLWWCSPRWHSTTQCHRRWRITPTQPHTSTCLQTASSRLLLCWNTANANCSSRFSSLSSARFQSLSRARLHSDPQTLDPLNEFWGKGHGKEKVTEGQKEREMEWEESLRKGKGREGKEKEDKGKEEEWKGGGKGRPPFEKFLDLLLIALQFGVWSYGDNFEFLQHLYIDEH